MESTRDHVTCIISTRFHTHVVYSLNNLVYLAEHGRRMYFALQALTSYAIPILLDTHPAPPRSHRSVYVRC